MKDKQINPWIPVPLEKELRDYLHANRPLKLGEFIAEAVREKLDRIAAETARAALHTGIRAPVQPCSESADLLGNSNGTEVVDRITDPDLQITDNGSNPISDIREETARAAVQLREQLIEQLRQVLSAQTVATWFEPLQLDVVDGERVTIIAPNLVVKDRIVKHYEPSLRLALREIGVTYFLWRVPEKAVEPPAEPERKQTAADLKDELLAYYGVVTSNMVRDYDVEDFQLVAHCSAEAVKAGILYSQMYVTGGKVRKFQYCIRAILRIEGTGLARVELVKMEQQYQQKLPGFGGDVVPIGRSK